VDADPAMWVLLDLNIAGRRFRTAHVEAEIDLSFFQAFNTDLPETCDELVANGAASITAILIDGPSHCVYGSGAFHRRWELAGYIGLSVQLNFAPKPRA
jgi:hypothetical protein